MTQDIKFGEWVGGSSHGRNAGGDAQNFPALSSVLVDGWHTGWLVRPHGERRFVLRLGWYPSERDFDLGVRYDPGDGGRSAARARKRALPLIECWLFGFQCGDSKKGGSRAKV